MTASETSTTQDLPSRTRTWAIFALKAVVTMALLGWLSRSGVLDLGSLRLLGSSPLVLCLTIATFVVVAVLLATSRWRVLLRTVDIEVSFGRAAALQLMALFFNTVVPGNVGGDVMKNLYVAERNPKATRTALLVLVLVERLIGLSGLVAAAALLVLARLPVLWGDARLWAPSITLGALILGLLVVPLGLLFSLRSASARAKLRSFGGSSRLLGGIADALDLAQAHQPRILQALGISICLHTVCMSYFTFLTGIYGAPRLDLGQVAVLFPLGILTLVLPVSLSGLGVGHVAFEQLFRLIGASNGANIFNLYLIGQLAPSLFGAIPWLFRKTKQPR